MSEETIADIVREMREMVENVTDSEGFRPAWAVYFEGFAERIEDAYERRLIASMDFLADKCANTTDSSATVAVLCSQPAYA